MLEQRKVSLLFFLHKDMKCDPFKCDSFRVTFQSNENNTTQLEQLQFEADHLKLSLTSRTHLTSAVLSSGRSCSLRGIVSRLDVT